MIKDLADNLMTEGKQHVRGAIEKRLSRHADFIKDRLRYKTYLFTGVVPKAAPDCWEEAELNLLDQAASRCPGSCDGARRRDVLRWCGVATSRDVPRWSAMVRDSPRSRGDATNFPRYSAIFRDIPRYFAICRDGAMCCDGWIQRYFAISCDTVGLPNCVRRPAMDPYVRIDSTQLRRLTYGLNVHLAPATGVRA